MRYYFYQYTGGLMFVEIGINIDEALREAGCSVAYPPDDFCDEQDILAVEDLQDAMRASGYPFESNRDFDFIEALPDFISNDDEFDGYRFGSYTAWCYRLSSQIDYLGVRAGFWRLLLELPRIRNPQKPSMPDSDTPADLSASWQQSVANPMRRRFAFANRIRRHAEMLLSETRDTGYTMDSFLLSHGLWRGSGVDPTAIRDDYADFGVYDVGDFSGRF